MDLAVNPPATLLNANSPLYNHLAHLEECSACFRDADRPNQYMTIMIMSKGKNNASTRDAWYKKCLSNPALAQAPVAASASVATPSSLGALPRPSSYAVPLSDTYQSKLREIENESMQRTASLVDGHSYARQAEKMVTLQWWSEDGGEPDTIDVPVPNHPWFHPAHSSDLINLYGIDKKMYRAFDPALDIWKVASVHSPPQLGFLSRTVRFTFDHRFDCFALVPAHGIPNILAFCFYPGRVFSNTLGLPVYASAKTVWSPFRQWNQYSFIISQLFPLTPHSLFRTFVGL
ncbi:hypothetical protein C8R44DRAFT_885378 [Mycena epipterygia]|nr:hypothetical protein C8R44DRAFT_885378 [Mycena epipterygia]